MSKDSLGIKAGRAALWQILGGGWQTLVRLGASVFLARALKPSDFGLFGMALLYQELMVSALSLGFGTGLIVKKYLSDEDLSTSFWMSCIIRLILFSIIFFSAPLAGKLWNNPRVIPIIRIISLTLLIQLISLVPGTLAIKNLKFLKINIIHGISILLESLVAILLAFFANLACWALVVGMLVNAIFYNICLWVSEGFWLPKLVLRRNAFKYLFRYGIYTWAFSVTNYLKQNIDYFMVGRMLGSYQLGLYEFAYRIPHLVFSRISQPVGAVIFPALSKIKDNNERIFAGYVKTVKFVTLVAFPVLFGLAAVADILVPVLWGNQWLPIVRPLQILSFCAAMRCLFQPMGSIFYCKNRPDIPFKVSVLTLIFTAIFVSVLGYFYGLVGVAIGMLLSVFPSFFVLWFAFRFMLKVSLFDFFKVLYPIVFSSLLCAISAYYAIRIFLAFHFDVKIILALAIFLGALVYVLSLFFLFPAIVKELLENVNMIFGNKFLASKANKVV